jgi:hypothetical protein
VLDKETHDLLRYAQVFEGLRLRCRVLNQHEAERIFGVAFMSRKREEALVRRRVSRVSLGAREPSPSPS